MKTPYVIPSPVSLRTALWVILLTILAFGRGGLAAEDVRLATMRLGTSWYVFGATLYKLIQNDLPPGHRLEILAKGGGVGNPILVERGEVQLALANRATALWAYEGQGSVYQGHPHRKLRALVGGLNSVWVSLLAREEFLQAHNLSTLEDVLKGKHPVRIVMKPKGSSVPVVADMIFEAMGTSRQQIMDLGGEIIQVDAQQIPNLLRNGRADLYIETTPPRHPTVTEVTLTLPMRFLDLPPAVLDPLEKAGLPRAEVPVSFKGQDKPTQAVDLGTVILASVDLSEDMAYRITRIVCENQETLAKAHKAWAKFNPRIAGLPEQCGIPLHPGAERYYREKGWLPSATQNEPSRKSHLP